MTASERLAALERPARPYWDEGAVDQESIKAANRCVDALVDALPEIVAMVRAAEHVTFYGQEAYKFNEWAGSELLKSLAALDAKLAEK